MPLRIEYKRGDAVGPKGCTYIQEEEPILDKHNKKQRVAQFSCSKCGNPFISELRLARTGQRQFCEDCSVKKKEYQIGELLGPYQKFEYLGEAGFNSSKKRKVKVRNIETEEIFETVLAGIINGKTKYGPKECYKYSIINSSKTKTKYHEGDTVTNPSGDSFLFVKEYREDGIRKGLFLNLQTGVYFYSNIYNVVYGTSTGTKKSIGEEKIEQTLNKMNITYMREKTFQDLKSPKGASLRYDFWIPDLNIAIEYDGQQHFIPVDIWGGVEHLNYLQQCDKIKNEYAIKNNFSLIRILYKDLNNINEEFIFQKIKERSKNICQIRKFVFSMVLQKVSRLKLQMAL